MGNEPEKTVLPDEAPVSVALLDKLIARLEKDSAAEIAEFEERIMAALNGEQSTQAVGILGSRLIGPAPKGTAKEAETPQAVSLHEIAKRSGEIAAKRKIEYEERRLRMDAAYQEFLAACSDAGYVFSHDAYADMDKDGDDCKAITYLQRQVANEKMTIPEAIEYAKEREWVTELTTFQKMLIALREVHKKVIVRKAKDNGDEIDVHARFEEALANGEISTLEEVIAEAEIGGWLRVYDPDRVTLRDKLDAEQQGYLDQLRKDEGRRGKPTGKGGKRTRGKSH